MLSPPYPCIRRHVAHRTGFDRRQFFFFDCGHDDLVPLSFRVSRQDQGDPFDVAWKQGMRGWRIITNRCPHFWIPKVSPAACSTALRAGLFIL